MSVEGKIDMYASGSDMPVDYLLRKQERTCDYMSPTIVEDFHRQALKDMRPEKVLFESDEIRGGRDINGQAFGNNISERFLAFRDTGFQSYDDVDGMHMPDGTFIDVGGTTEQDPRGVATGPNMRAHADQQFVRGPLYNYRPDGDDSIPSDGINPWQMNANVRGIQNISAHYYKNFDTSFDSWHNGGMAPGLATSVKQQVKTDQTIKDPATAANRMTMDATTYMSNKIPIGWRRTTDNRFEVSKYGRKNIGKTYSSEDWYKNRANANVDHDVMMSWQDTNVSKATALKMIDLSKQKADAFITGLQGMHWSTAKESQSTKHKLTPADMTIAKRQTKATQSDAAHTKLDGKSLVKSGTKNLQKHAQSINKTKMHSTVFEKMGMANRAVTKKQKDDLRNSVHESARRDATSLVENNKNVQKFAKPGLLWDSKIIYKKGKSRAVHNYKAAKKKTEKSNMTRLDKHKFESDSFVGNQKHGAKFTKVVHGSKTLRHDNDFGAEGVHTRSIGGLGTKNMRANMSRDTKDNFMGDMVSSVY